MSQWIFFRIKMIRKRRIEKHRRYRVSQTRTIFTSCLITTFPQNLIAKLNEMGKQCFEAYNYETLANSYPNAQYFYITDTRWNLISILLLDNWSTVWDVCTNIKYRRQGYQKQLFNYLFKTMRQLGKREVFLNVSRDNTNAIGLYQQLGFDFVPADSRTPYGELRMMKRL